MSIDGEFIFGVSENKRIPAAGSLKIGLEVLREEYGAIFNLYQDQKMKLKELIIDPKRYEPAKTL